MRRRNDARGAVPIEFAAGIGLLVLPVALLVLQLPRWLERVQAAEDLALESARLCAQANSLGEGQAAAAVLATQTNDVIRVQCRADAGNNEPGTTVRAAVTVRVPAVQVPMFRVNTGNFTVTRQHAERVDQYRSYGP